MGVSNEFARAIVKSLDVIYDTLGHDAPGLMDLIKLQAAIDKENMEKSDFSNIDRFPESLVQTYRACCNAAKNRKYDALVEERLREIGKKVFDHDRHRKMGLRAGAKETIEFLKDQGDDVHILTMGNDRIQRGKMVAIGLDELVRWENIHVVPKKETSVYAALTEGRDKSRTYMAGDSIKSDVNPALEAGLWAIYLPVRRTQWAFDDDPRGIIHPERTFQFQDILDIKHNYKLLDILESHQQLQEDHRKLEQDFLRYTEDHPPHNPS